MAALVRLVVLFAVICASAQAQYSEERAPRYIASETKVAPAPVAILKQINRHNEDGSYTYGYEGADGSFKIETKSPNGDVKGKYGYKDDTGKLRVVEYGADKYGFQPAGEGITVAPPTLVDESKEENHRASKSQGRSQYNAPAAQSIDYDYEEVPAPTLRPRPAPQQYRPAPPPQQQYRPHSDPAPAPPRPMFFAGAAPAPVQNANYFSPTPQKQKQQRPKQDYRLTAQFQQNFPPNPQINFNQPLNYEAAQPRYTPNQAPFAQAPAQFTQAHFGPTQDQFAPQHQQRSQPFSMLDQLLKEYALPQNGAAPLHDISFGSL